MTETQPPYHSRSIVLFGASVRAAAESARRGGFRVIGIDLFGDHDTRAACDQFFLIPTRCDADNQADRVILDTCAGLPVLAVGGLHGHQKFIDSLLTVGLWIGDPEIARSELCDPTLLTALIRSSDICLPPTFASADLLRSGAQPSAARWLTKRRVSSGGLGVGWWKAGDPAGGDDLLQRWVPGRSYGVTYLSDGTNVQMLGVCRSLFTRNRNLPFVYAGSCGPVRLATSMISRLEQLGVATVDSLGLSGLFNADVVISQNGQIWLLEINARWSGSSEIIERSLEQRASSDRTVSLITQVLKQQLLDSALPITSAVSNDTGEQVWMKRILYARRQRRFRLRDHACELESNQSLHDIPSDGTMITKDAPLMTLITNIDSDSGKAIGAYRRARTRMTQ